MKAHSIIRVVGALVCAGLLHVSSANAWTETVLYSFKGGSDGANPAAGLINVNGTLYGMTEYGGVSCNNNGSGTVFSVTPSGIKTTLYAFKCGSDGIYPTAGLINVNGTLYGTTPAGGYGPGTVFSVTPAGAETVLYLFKGGSDGANPAAGLINVNGTLYGTTYEGGGGTGCGVPGCGTIFSLTAGGIETVLHAFASGTDGAQPEAGLINVNGTLYGTTEYGGGFFDHGIVFSIAPKGTENVLHEFNGGRRDGSHPWAALLYVNGILYGTTTQAGSYKDGTVFSVTRSGREKVVYSFAGGSDGKLPYAGLINVRGTLYGTTEYGGEGKYGYGTVFSVTPNGTETVLHAFGGHNDGAYPISGLIAVNGVLYGTTFQGGSDGGGTVFSITP